MMLRALMVLPLAAAAGVPPVVGRLLGWLKAQVGSLIRGGDDYGSCSYREECSLSGFGPVTRVWTGDVCIRGAPWAFDVFRGDKDKVMVYFEGGGGCWDFDSTNGTYADFCYQTVQDVNPKGVFDRRRSPLKDYTIVEIKYCSGDSHYGNVNRTFTKGDASIDVTQHGGNHTLTAVEWIRAQQASGALDAELASLVVGGASAGSIGSQFWSYGVASKLEAKQTTLLYDSYVGVFPKGKGEELMTNSSACDFLDWNGRLKAACLESTLKLQDITEATINEKLRDARVAVILSKADDTQIKYYAAIDGGEGAQLDEKTFYKDMQRILESYAESGKGQRPGGDVVTFVVDGAQHTFMPEDVFYTALTTGADNGTTTENGENLKRLVDWIADVITPGGGKNNQSAACEQCHGALRSLDDVDDDVVGPYCDKALADRCAIPFPSASVAAAAATTEL